jgi:hypothetical protein
MYPHPTQLKRYAKIKKKNTLVIRRTLIDVTRQETGFLSSIS